MRTDNELIKDFQEGNEEAFSDLVNRYLSSTYRFFRKFTDSSEEAEDLAQNIFIKMYKALKKAKIPAAYEGSTYTIFQGFDLNKTCYERCANGLSLIHI